MSIYEYDEERELKLIRADERELGREEERKRSEAAIERERENAQREKENAQREKEAAIISLCKELGCTKDETVDKLADKCHISREDAVKKVDRYWE